MARKNILTHSKKKKAYILVQANRLEEAKALYAQICQADKSDADALIMLGVVNGKLGKHAEASECFSRAVAIRPRNAEAHHNLGIAFREQGKLEEAVGSFREALRIQPDRHDTHDSLAHALLNLGRLGEAADTFRAALRLKPGNAEMHSNLGSVYQAQGLLEQAVACYREAQRLKPGITYDNLGSALSSQGKFEEALACYREGLRRHPADTRIHSNLLMTLNYLPDQDAEAIFREHRAWGRIHGKPNANPLSFTNIRDPVRRLRIGYVSPDFRTHSVAYFIEPLLANHDGVETVCYSDVPRPDATTKLLQGLADQWRDVSKFSDEQMAALIRGDGIDILVDLAGHTACNRLPVFTRKPAPVQATWLGYPNTTGLATIDYRLTDAIADPHGLDVFYTEKLVRLDGCFLCYQPSANAPPIAPLPAAGTGHATFGSFNNLAKVNSRVTELWAELLKAFPAARLVIKNPSLTDPPTRERYQELFAAQGVGSERVELLGHTATREEHLALYGRIDIALDTFPYNGTTTTCEALWMGVPVITLAGENHAGRVGASLLTTLNLNECIADSPHAYLSRVSELANDRERLVHLRMTLRERMRNSPLCDAQAFTRKVEAVYREMWRVWCAKAV